MNNLKLKAKVKPIFRGYINDHAVTNEKIYNTIVSLLKAIERNNYNLNITHPEFLINDFVYTMNLLYEEGGINDLKYVKKILLPTLQTMSDLSKLTPIVDDLVGYKGFYPLTRLRNSLIDNLYTS